MIKARDFERSRQRDNTLTESHPDETTTTMMMMKNPVVLVACTLLFSSLAVLATQSTAGPNSCCFEFYSKPLPRKKVVSYIYTNELCPLEGVIFKMASNSEICADPSQEWVKKTIAAKDKMWS